MTDLFLQIDVTKLIGTTLLGLAVYFAVFLAVVIDLWSGLRRSKRLGIKLKSKGLRSSLRKFNDYIQFIVIASIVDILLYAFTLHELVGIKSLPFLTLATGIVAIAIEIRSVYENTDRNRQRDISIAIDNLIELGSTKGDAMAILEQLKKRIEPIELTEEQETPDYPND